MNINFPAGRLNSFSNFPNHQLILRQERMWSQECLYVWDFKDEAKKEEEEEEEEVRPGKGLRRGGGGLEKLADPWYETRKLVDFTVTCCTLFLFTLLYIFSYSLSFSIWKTETIFSLEVRFYPRIYTEASFITTC